MTKRLTLSPLFTGLILVAFSGCSAQAPEDGSNQARTDGDDPVTSEPGGDIDDCVIAWEECWDETDMPEDGDGYEEPTECDMAFEECLTTIDTTECDQELDACFDEGGSEDACWFHHEECLFGDYYTPCEDELGACLDAGIDPEECYFSYDVCWSEPGEPGIPECEVELDDCLNSGVNPEECFVSYDQCWGGGEPWGPEEECFYLFDDCLYLGVSEATCSLVLDECIEAIGDHGDCPDEPGDPNEPGDPGDPGDSWPEDPCIDDFEQCLEDGRSDDECVEELMACDEVVIF